MPMTDSGPIPIDIMREQAKRQKAHDEAVARKKAERLANGKTRRQEEAGTLAPPVGDPQVLLAPPFRALGHAGGRYYFLSEGLMRVRDYSARQLTVPGDLFELAPLDWWMAAYPPPDGAAGRFDAHRAGSALIEQASKAGIYDSRRVRGLGIWLDAGRVVQHLGDRLIVDGVSRSLLHFESEWSYPQQVKVALDPSAPPLTQDEGRLFIDLCAGIAWVHPERDARLLAGWVAVAMLAGCLPWRPHLWLNSEAGEGKTWILERIVLPVVRAFAEIVASQSYPAGVKRILANDARVLIYDESEGDTPAGQIRMQGMLELMRQAASDSSGDLVQAEGAGMGVLRFRPKFIGVLGSVQVSLSTAADLSRFLPMPTRESTDAEFAELKLREARCMTPGFGDRLVRRMAGMVPTIRHNIEMLQTAIALYANKRAGDTLGVPMSGYLALTSDEQLTPETARAFVERHAWLREAAAEQVPEKEWRLLLMFLRQYRLRLGVGHEYTLAELAEIMARRSLPPMGAPAMEDLERAFFQAGMQIITSPKGGPEGPCVVIANTSAEVAKALRGQPWAVGWQTLLKRGGAKPLGATHFRGLGTHRALAIPLRIFLGDDTLPPAGDRTLDT